MFYLSARPTVDETITTQLHGGFQGSTRTIAYSLDKSSFSIQHNPAVTNIATIQNLGEQVVLKGNLPPSVTVAGTPEQVDSEKVYTNVGSITGGLCLISPRVWVRISFSVVPKNGAPPCMIVKTFVANLVVKS